MYKNLKQNKGVAKVLIIVLIALLVIVVGGVAAFFIAKGVGAIEGVNFSSKSKLLSSFTGIEKKLEGTNNSDANTLKILKNLNDKPYEAEIKLSGNINNVTIPGVSSTEIASVKSLINGADLTLKTQADLKNDKQNSTILYSGTELGSFVYTPDTMAIRIPEVDQKYMAIFKDSLSGTKYSELSQIFDMINEFEMPSADFQKIKFTDSEKKHFKDTYASIFSDNIKDDQLKTEKAEIEIDGKKISCDKVILELTPAQCGELLEKYVAAYEKDSEGRDILANKIIELTNNMPFMAQMLETEGITKNEFNAQLKTSLSQMSDMLRSVVDGLKNSSSNTKLSMIVYGDLFKTYRVEYRIDASGDIMVITSDLKDDGVYSKISFNADNQKFEMNFDILKNGFNMGFDYPEQSVKMSISYKENDKSQEGEFKLSLLNKEIASIKLSNTINSNTDSEYNSNAKLDVKVDYQGVNVDGTISLDSSIKTVNSIEIPSITKENSTDLVKSGALDELLNSLQSLMGGKSGIKTPSTPSIPAVPSVPSTDLFDTNTTDLFDTDTSDLFNTNTIDSSLFDF